MSVVNDVLKNLNQRHAQENMAHHIPYLYEEKPALQYILWALLSLIFITGVVIAVSQFQQPIYAIQPIELPSDLFSLDDKGASANILLNPTEENSGDDKQLIKKVLPEKIDLERLASKIAVEKIAINKVIDNKTPKYKSTAPTFKRPQPNKSTQNTIVNKSRQSQAVDQVVKALKNGDHKTAQKDLAKTPKAMQDEIKLRLMVKENPEKVLPYINSNFINYSESPSLLAMAAQAQQRIQQHFSAISIYKQLIKIQPKDARWRAGIAISLEASGEVIAAKHMYQLALSMPGLPRSLAAFSQKRLSALK